MRLFMVPWSILLSSPMFGMRVSAADHMNPVAPINDKTTTELFQHLGPLCVSSKIFAMSNFARLRLW